MHVLQWHLLGLPNLRVEDEAAVASVVGRYEMGMDFVDALHLSSPARGVTESSTLARVLRGTWRAGERVGRNATKHQG